MKTPCQAIYREPEKDGRKGLVFSASRYPLQSVATKVRRTSPFTLGGDPDVWKGRVIEVDFDVPPTPGLGLIDSYGFAQALTVTGGRLRIFRGHDADRIEQPYLLEDVLTFDAVLSPNAFGSLWNEMMGRAGGLEIDLDFRTFVLEPHQDAKHLTVKEFLMIAPSGDDADEPVVNLTLTVADNWGA